MSQGHQEVCHVCGGPLIEKQIEKLLRGGDHTAVVNADAEVCQRCGEQLFSPETVHRFEDIRDKLRNQQTGEFTPIGQAFVVPTEVQPTQSH